MVRKSGKFLRKQSMIDTDDDLPSPYQWYEHQIAGHHPSVIKNGLRQIGIIKNPNNDRVLLKVVQDDARGICEEQLYKDIVDAHQNDRTDNPIFYDLFNLVPQFFGTRSLVIGKRQKVYKFLELEDILSSYSQPCVMDIKIGRVSFDPKASNEKKISELKKSPFQQECGFRILGYRLSDEHNFPKIKDRDWGRTRDSETMDDAFAEFLNGRPKDADILAAEFLRRVHIVQDYFNTQNSLQFYASSLLFVYEGDKTKKPNVDVKMIDFSHVFRVQNARDENYIAGIHYICKVLTRLIQKSINNRLT
ncbi:Kinase [Aphelenchoides bicaudatus]|nr:Kinase [Aphelenchoides bicaudatus]